VAVGRDYFGSYRLVRLIRIGHTCQIWESIDERTNRRCALKALQKEHVKNRSEFAILKNEFEVGKLLKHKYIIDTYDFVTEFDLPFLVLEFFAARNMKQLIRQEPERVPDLAQPAIEHAAESLAYMHEQGWLHRDVKPDNFLVADDATVKLIDFAIAQKQVRGLGKLFAGKGKVQGTRSYMSPEQIRGAALDARTDVYSFGCVLYELTTGKPPFTAVSANDLLNKHCFAPVPVAMATNRNVTPEFSDLVLRMMAKKPEQRPESIALFLRQYRTMRPFKSERKPSS
jgi:serine/threonine protein kinase